MDKKVIANTLKDLKENSPKRNFKQSIDLILNLKGLDLKKAEHQINMFAMLHYNTGRKISVCALIGPELESRAKETCDEVILLDQFAKFKDKKEIKKLAGKHDFFIAQANIMPKIATVFGRFLGPKGKMPNPKIGCILPPNANVKPLIEKLKKTVSLATKNEPTVKCRVGKEEMSDDEVVDNIITVYNTIIHKLPNEKQNVKSAMLKLTMGPAFVIGGEKQDKSKGEVKPKEDVKKPEEKQEVKEGKQEEAAKKEAKPTKEEKPKSEKKTEKKPTEKKEDPKTKAE
ncbi:MAG: 50S ribosomal protein L1 [Candidatus Woesearchaeota archaeon]|jgi:large subunit ribosomal protein L1|nr:50S ribosomal protein L1 [Candidatus Woesearchaeota archaeon]MDP7623217.1 50S ribosomal protein L1 [Candidatus Woesearchaeota archaeon]HJN56795.1 50S ribosomal protein L1 [Candidatus Woesearchaeota archaeon]|tara:strand:- start:39764 stop:40621 length:858 start_codon:yes stop_codon:yes gene_type:complete